MVLLREGLHMSERKIKKGGYLMFCFTIQYDERPVKRERYP